MKNLITENIIIDRCKKALKNKKSLYIVNIDNTIQFIESNLPSWEFLKKYNLDSKNLIQGLCPESILKYKNCNDNSLSLIIDMCNKSVN